MKHKRISATRVIRHLIQLAAFILFPGLFITVFSAVRDISMAVLEGSFSIGGLSAQLIIVSAVFLITALWGRFFCGYLCSFGMLLEIIAFFPQKLLPARWRLPVWLDHALKFLKYLILAFIIVGVWILALPVDPSFDPWGVSGLLIAGNFSALSAAIPTGGFLLLLSISVASVFVERAFCRYLCPLGALFTLISGKRLYKIRRKSPSCTNCGLCTKKCSMGIDVAEKEAVTSGECIDCMECIAVCPQGSLSADPAGAVAGTAAAAVMGGMVIVGDLTVEDVPAPVSARYHAGEEQNGRYVDGVYTGTGRGFRGDTKVEVTVEGGYITDITVLSYEDDREFFDRARSSVIDEIIEEQSLGVSAVSGATFSCDGLIGAVADALDLESVTTVEGSSGTGSDASRGGAHTDSPTASPPPADEGTPQSDASISENVDDGQALHMDPGPIAVPDGVYEGMGNGYQGPTDVSVVVENGRITDITVKSYTDDSGYFSHAQDAVISQIIDSQSWDVPPVSGATFSSNSIMEAVANALGASIETPEPTAPDTNGHGQGGLRRRMRRRGGR